MANKFVNVPLEADTRILFQYEARIGEYDVLYQKWVWESISAESLIFVNDDIAGLEDDEIEKAVRALPLVKPGSGITLKRCDSGFTFVNFNFEPS